MLRHADVVRNSLARHLYFPYGLSQECKRINACLGEGFAEASGCLRLQPTIV